MENIQCNFIAIPKNCFSTPLVVCLISVYTLKDVVDVVYLTHYILCIIFIHSLSSCLCTFM